MSFDREKLLSLLPALYRARDEVLAEELGLAGPGPLSDLLALIAEQFGVLEEDLAQLEDDAFIETCAAWAVPYIGDLIGYRPLHGTASAVASPRAEVAHTIAYRRRKGTLSVLEQLARDVTGWNAVAAEYFQRVVVSQYSKHPRPFSHAAPDLRRWNALEHVGDAFDGIPRSIDVRRIASSRGRHNVPNVGVFLWPLDAHAQTRAPAAQVDARRWRFSPLNHDRPLVTQPQTEDDIRQLAGPLNVPTPISRRVLHERLADYYGGGTWRRSLRLYVGTADPLPEVPESAVCACHLGDQGGTWAHLPPAGKFAIDPVLGRIALPDGLPADTRVEVDAHYAFGADIGGGEYERASSFEDHTTATVLRVPDQHPTLTAALAALGGAGVVEITDSGRYAETLDLDAAANARIELRAANGCAPIVILSAPMTLRGSTGSDIVLNGLLIVGDLVQVPKTAGNTLRQLTLRHCTLVPGRSLTGEGAPAQPDAVALRIDIADCALRAERCILGALRVVESADATLTDCALDATAQTRVAYAAPDDAAAGGPLSLTGCTAIGKLHARSLPLVSNSVLLASLAAIDNWDAPVIAQRRHEGCVRYSLVPPTALVPRRHRCVPGDDTTRNPVLRFVSLRYGTAQYAQLGSTASEAIRRGADDEGEMGVYHHVRRPQREANLRLRLDEYLRVGLEVGVFYES
jgi:hypothetical protein